MSQEHVGQEAGRECLPCPPGWNELGWLHDLLHALFHFFG